MNNNYYDNNGVPQNNYDPNAAAQPTSRVNADGQYRYVPQPQYVQPVIVQNAQPAAQQNIYRYAEPTQQQSSSEKSDPFSFFKKHKTILTGAALGIAASLIIGGCGALIYKGASSSKGGNGASANDSVNLVIAETPITETVIPEDDATLLTYSQIAAKVRCGVVGITCYTDAYGWGSTTYAQGSGFIISDTGYVVTNSHVIQDEDYGKFKITVTITDENSENTEVECEVIGIDTKSDLAVVKFDPTGLSFTVCELGDSEALILGEEVVAIGNPGGAQFAGSVTNGIVSGLNRVIEESSTTDGSIKYIQTDAAINPGNSGGPLLNMYGQVIGINSSKIVASGYEGLGFSIPMNTAKPLIEQIIQYGSVRRPAMGVSVREISEQTAAWYDVPQGLLISGMADNSSFKGTSAAIGDIITAIDGKEITSFTDFDEALASHAIGDTVSVTLFRRGNEDPFEVEIILIADSEAVYSQNQSIGQ